MRLPRPPLALLATGLLALACGAVSTDPQLPPTTGAVEVEAWLAQGLYKAWRCEPAVHAALSPSPHGPVRVCVNAKVVAQPAGPGEYPVGAAAVKELYSALDGGSVIGHAVGVHVSAGSGASTWYWYERNPTLSAPAKNGSPGLVADGLGPTEGVAGTFSASLCTSCHELAGSDQAHRTNDSHDFLYTHVP